LPFDAALVALPPRLALLFPAADAGVLVVAMFATEGDFAPPHPASTTPAAAARSTTPPDRRCVDALSRSPALFKRSGLPFICSVSTGRSGVETVVANGT